MKRLALPILAAAVALVAGPAFAHPGHGPHAGLLAGFGHPFTGLDHVLGMTAVGLWAGIVGGRARWLWPAAFVVCMLAGFGLGTIDGAPPELAWAIAATIMALGAALLFEVRLPAMAGMALASLFGLAHGYAHGKDLPSDAAALSYAAGFTLATAALLGGGLWLSQGVGRPWRRLAGAALAVCGTALLLTS